MLDAVREETLLKIESVEVIFRIAILFGARLGSNTHAQPQLWSGRTGPRAKLRGNTYARLGADRPD